MTWEVFTGGKLQAEAPAVSISTLGRMHLNKKASLLLVSLNAKSVSLMINKSTSEIGLKAFSDESGHFKLRFVSGNSGAGFSCVAFLNYIGYDWTVARSFPVAWVNHVGLVFKVPSGLLGHPAINRRKNFAKKEKGASKEAP